MTKAMTDTELQRARELCVALGECTTTYYLTLLLREIERLRRLPQPVACQKLNQRKEQ